MSLAYILVIACGVLALAYGFFTSRVVLAANAGNARMQEISSAVQLGANAYLNRQYRAIAIVGVVILIILGVLLGKMVAIGYLIGAVLSGAAGYIGMNVSVRANVRTAQAARSGLAAGLDIAFRAGAVTGMLVVGLGLLGAGCYYFILRAVTPDAELRAVLEAMVALGFGASLIAIFVTPPLLDRMLVLPLAIGAVCIVTSVIGTYFVRLGADNGIMRALYKGVIATGLLSVVAVSFISKALVGL